MAGSDSNNLIGIVLSTVTHTSLVELTEIAKCAEKHGFSTVYINEGKGDAITLATAIALKTKSISVGTNIANIYFRHPYLAANSIRLLAEASNGRARIGFGISHRDLLRTVGIDMGNARTFLKRYVLEVRLSLQGESNKGFLTPEKAKYHTPIFVAANTLETAELAGSVGDGIMPYLSPISSISTLISAAKKTAEKEKKIGTFDCVLSIPTFLSDTKTEALSAARYNLAFFAMLPNYRRQWRRAGFGKEMDLIQKSYRDGAHRKDIASLIPETLVDQVCLCGTAKQCQKTIEAFRNQGVTEPVLAVSPVSQTRHQATLEAIEKLSGV